MQRVITAKKTYFYNFYGDVSNNFINIDKQAGDNKPSKKIFCGEHEGNQGDPM